MRHIANLIYWCFWLLVVVLAIEGVIGTDGMVTFVVGLLIAYIVTFDRLEKDEKNNTPS